MSKPITSVSWPDQEDRPRIEHGAARHSLLDGDFEKYLAEFLTRVQGEKRRDALGILDTAWNLLASYARQMSTPGLYGRRPTIHSPDGSAWLTGRRGLLDRARWSPGGIRLEYLTRGLGDMMLCVHVSRATQRLQLRRVFPYNVYVVADPDEPNRAEQLRELRLRRLRGEWRWTWDCYDISDLDQPQFYITESGDDRRITDQIVSGVPAEGYIGAAYPWRFADGTPYIRYVHYQASVGDGYWSWRDGLGLHRGSFQAARLSNTSLLAADAAAIPVVAVVDGKVKGLSVRNDGQGGSLATLELTPGALFDIMSLGERQAQLHVISGSADAVALASMVRTYSLSIMAQHGLRGEDVSRDQANPTSAAALSIQDASRREGQRQLRDLFCPADEELIAMAAAQAAGLEIGDAPERGHEIEYHLIPETPAERAARAADEEAELQQGLVSRLQLYQRRHNCDRETAIRALRQVAQDNAEVEQPK